MKAAATILLLFGLAAGCSTYGHYETNPSSTPSDTPPGETGDNSGTGDTREGSGKCDPATECCNPSSCNPACPDGFVCMAGQCLNVLKICGK